MNKILMVIPVMIILLGAMAFATIDSRKVQLSQVVVYTIDYGINSIVRVENNGGSKLNGLHTTMTIPELGLRVRSSDFKLSSNGGAAKQLMLDADNVAPGEYYVRITVGNGDIKRVKYRIITIE